MSQSVTVRKLETVPPSRRVRHFDELDEREQSLFASAAAGRYQCREAESLGPGDVVVFTEYYEVVAC